MATTQNLYLTFSLMKITN